VGALDRLGCRPRAVGGLACVGRPDDDRRHCAAVDLGAQTLTVEAAARGKLRAVVIELRPASRIVRFIRARESGKSGFIEQPVPLADLRVGWTVSVTTRHEGDREIAEVVRIVLER